MTQSRKSPWRYRIEALRKLTARCERGALDLAKAAAAMDRHFKAEIEMFDGPRLAITLAIAGDLADEVEDIALGVRDRLAKLSRELGELQATLEPVRV